jgi:hypothetical protein
MHRGICLSEMLLLCTQCARKRCRVTWHISQYLRATNCYKLSELNYAIELTKPLFFSVVAPSRFTNQRGCDVGCTCHRGRISPRACADAPCTPLRQASCHLVLHEGSPRPVPHALCNPLSAKPLEKIVPTGIGFAPPGGPGAQRRGTRMCSPHSAGSFHDAPLAVDPLGRCRRAPRVLLAADSPAAWASCRTRPL